MTAERARYRFGPLERRGLVAGLRGGQIAGVSAGLLVALGALHASPGAAGAAAALVAVAVAVACSFWPVAGRTPEEWVPTLVRWGADRFRASSPDGGRPAGRSILAGLDVLDAPGPASLPGPVPAPGDRRRYGVLRDRRARTFTAVMAVRGHGFALLGPEEKERRVGSWAAVLASLARQGSAVHRLQWLATAMPDDGGGVRDFLALRGLADAGSRPRRSYEQLLLAAGAVTRRHEVLVAVQVHAGRTAGRAVRAAGGGDAGACSVLLREVANLARMLADADVEVEAVLSPRSLLDVLCRLTDRHPITAAGPARARQARRRGPTRPAARAVAPTPTVPTPTPVPDPPMVAEWSRVRTGPTWHATYWIAEWPRVDVGPDFLGPLLLGPVRRTVSVVLEPEAPMAALRQVAQARTADLADTELRRRGGFLVTARRAREAELVSRREAELAEGHGAFRFTGYVTVTAPDPKSLEDGCAATEQAAGQALLELRRLYGDQQRALTCALPLARGLA